MLTVLTWLWHNPSCRTQFKAEHVNTWADMVRRNLSMPHRIACATDMPQGIDPGVEIITPPGDFHDVQPTWGPRKPNCYRRLAMFRRDAGEIFGKRFVCMDLDCVIGGPLDPLFDRKDDLVLFKGTASDRPYNGSMMLIRAGCRPEVFEKFDKAAAFASGTAFHGSDQAWLALCLGWGEATWDASDGVYFWGREYDVAKKAKACPRILFFPGKLKPWDLAPIRIDPFTSNNYRIAEREAA
jgi:hypothetical protein